jgi:uncharacterized protein YciI
VEYFFYCRGRPGTEALLEELAEAHWSFMDGYAEAMIARGPTLTPDRTTWTGSMHMVDLPDAQAAQGFAFQEPFYRAGVYSEVLVRRWGNALGRRMWDYPPVWSSTPSPGWSSRRSSRTAGGRGSPPPVDYSRTSTARTADSPPFCRTWVPAVDTQPRWRGPAASGST